MVSMKSNDNYDTTTNYDALGVGMTSMYGSITKFSWLWSIRDVRGLCERRGDAL
jgi:hypothetical protein